MSELPIHAVLPDLLAALRTGSNAVLVAPPGAGKTTAVAPALLAEQWCTGEIILLSPRRLAARAAEPEPLRPAFGRLGLGDHDLRAGGAGDQRAERCGRDGPTKHLGHGYLLLAQRAWPAGARA